MVKVMSKIKLGDKLQAIQTFIKPFRWYVAFYMLEPLILLETYFYPPAKDDPI